LEGFAIATGAIGSATTGAAAAAAGGWSTATGAVVIPGVGPLELFFAAAIVPLVAPLIAAIGALAGTAGARAGSAAHRFSLLRGRPIE
jgi:hypothetical protein